MRNKPDFLIIGAARSGTTSLYNYIIQHPAIAPAVKKEVHYFDLQYDKGDQWYLQQFSNLKKVSGEASPMYLFHPHVPERIKKLNKNIKLIVLLRNPIDRAYSHFNSLILPHYSKMSFETALQLEKDYLENERQNLLYRPDYYRSNFFNLFSSLDRGIYIKQLKQWYAVFDEDQIMVLHSSDLFERPNAIANQVFDYLGLRPFAPQINCLNASKSSPMTDQKRKELIHFFKPHNENLYEYLGINFKWE